MKEPELRNLMSKVGVSLSTSKTGRGWIEAPCPFAPYKHAGGKDRNPSFAVKAEEGGISAYVCRACGSHGRIANLIRELGRYREQEDQYEKIAIEADKADFTGISLGDFEEAIEQVETPPEPLMMEMYEGVYPPASESMNAVRYCKKRGLSTETMDNLGLVYDQRERRVMFPIRDRKGNTYGWSGRAIDPSTKPKIRDYEGLPKRWLILGAERWNDDAPLIIVEGLFGYAHLVHIGVEEFANVGAILGNNLTKQKADIIKNFNQTTMLLFDNDEGGDIGLFGPYEPDGGRHTKHSAVAQLVKHIPVLVPEWPENKIDPDQLEIDEVENMLDNTPPFGLQPVAQDFT